MKPRKIIENKLLQLGCTEIVLTYRNQWFYMDECPRWEVSFVYDGIRVEMEGIGDNSLSAANNLIEKVSEDVVSGFIYDTGEDDK